MGVTQQLWLDAQHTPASGLASRSLGLRELRYFHSVARTGNFNRAARDLNISQPTVSHQVAKLEEGVGTPLFIRHGRGVTLTQAGATLLDRVDRIMRLLDAPLEEAPVPERTAGTITLGIPAECAPLLVPLLVTRCRERWPRVTLSVQETDSASLEESVMSGRVDAAILQDSGEIDDWKIDPILTEGLGLVTAPGRVLGETDIPVRPRELIGHDIILPRSRHWIHRRVAAAWFRRGIPLDRVQEADSVSVIEGMIKSNLGYAILPLAAVRDAVARGSLIFRQIEQMSLFGVHAIARRDDLDPGPATIAFCDMLREAITDLVSNKNWVGADLIEKPQRYLD